MIREVAVFKSGLRSLPNLTDCDDITGPTSVQEDIVDVTGTNGEEDIVDATG